MRSYAASHWTTSSGRCDCPRRCPTCSRHSRWPPRQASWAPSSARTLAAVKEGLGRAIVNFNQQYITGPEQAVGDDHRCRPDGHLLLVAVRIAEVLVLRRRPADVDVSADNGGATNAGTSRRSAPRRRGQVVPGPGGGRRWHSRTSTSGVAPDEFVSLIGPSGCGKSTLLRIVGDLITPPAGVSRSTASQPHRPALDRDYGMVFQAPVLFDWRTVEANVRLPLEVMKMDQRRARPPGAGEARPRRAGCVPTPLPAPAVGRHAATRGDRSCARVRAGAAAHGRALRRARRDDPGAAQRRGARIWARTGTTVLFVTHSIPEAVFLSTRVVVMSARPGRISHVVDIDLPQPAIDDTRESDRYFELVTVVRESLRAQHAGTAARAKAEGAIG